MKVLSLLLSVALLAHLSTAPSLAKAPETKEAKLHCERAVSGTELVAMISDQCLIGDGTANLESTKELAPLAAALLTAVGTKAIDKGLDLAAAKLRAASADQPTVFDSHDDGYLYSISATELLKAGTTDEKVLTYLVTPRSTNRCLHVIAMGDGSPAKAAEAWSQIKAVATEIVGQTVDTKFLENSGRIQAFSNDGVPKFLAEIRLLRSSDNSAMRLVPTFVAYREALSAANSPRDRTITIAVILSRSDRSAFLTDVIKFGDWQPGIALGGPEATRFATSWSAMPAAPAAATALAAEFSAMSDEQLKFNHERIKAHQRLSPFTASVSLVETVEGRKWLATIADVLSASKQEVGSALTNELLPEKRQAAEAAEMTSVLSHQQNLALALIDERSACASWELAKKSGSADVITKWRDLVESRFKVNIAAISVGEPVRFPDPVLAGCTAQ